VESTVNQVSSKRVVKKQDNALDAAGRTSSSPGRTRVLNDQLADDFRRWYPSRASPVSAAATPVRAAG
jgi:hypothetical protein